MFAPLYCVLFGFCFLTAPLSAAVPLEKVTVLALDPAQGQVEISLADAKAKALPVGCRLLVVIDGQPLGWFALIEQNQAKAIFKRPAWTAAPAAGAPAAWLARPDLTAKLLDRWPLNASLQAEIDRLGPGAATAWLRNGTNQGVRVGDRWWLRLNGQPVARLDTLLAEPDLCFCAVVPLVADWRLTREQRVTLWPPPRRQTRGEARSAVSFVEAPAAEPEPGRTSRETNTRAASRPAETSESAEDANQTEPGAASQPAVPASPPALPEPVEKIPQVVWIPAPRPVACPPEPRIDFYRDGRYIGCGVVEKRDPLFWHVRTLPEAGVREIRIGDEATIRTQADLDAGRFVARVFEARADSGLINASDADGLTAGQSGTVWRDGRPVGEIAVRKPQAGYAVIQPAAGTPGLRLWLWDEIRFAPPPAPSVLIGTIERVTDETLFTIKFAPPALQTPPAAPRVAPPLLTPLAVRAGTRTIGVAILVAADEKGAVGFSVDASLMRPLAAGDELTVAD